MHAIYLQTGSLFIKCVENKRSVGIMTFQIIKILVTK